VERTERSILAAALGWHEARVSFETAVADLPPALRGRRPDGYPHSPWELLEHVRLAQADLVAFMEDPGYVAPPWPDGYWPPTPAPASSDAWDASVAAVLADRERLQAIAQRPTVELAARIPWGEGQTYLRTLLVALDHASYHVGQLVAVRRLLGAWPGG